MTKYYLNVDEAVAKVFTGMMQPAEGMQVFTNRLDHCEAVLRRCIDHNCRVTALATDNFAAVDQFKILEVYGESSLHYTKTNTPEWIRPVDQFHLAFGVYPFTFNHTTEDERQQLAFQSTEDRMMHWRVSQGKEHRIAPTHLIGLEGLMRATQVAGYFAAVVPKNWVGRDMPYMKWWTNRAAVVARIGLPESLIITKRDIQYKVQEQDLTAATAPDGDSILRAPAYYQVGADDDDNPVYEDSGRTCYHPEHFTRESIRTRTIEVAAPGKWELVIWHRPLNVDGDINETSTSAGVDKIMPHAKFRFAPFIYRLESDSPQDINACIRSFHKHEWYRQSVKLWHKAIAEYHTNSWCGTYRYQPVGVPSIENMFFFEPTPDHTYHIRIMEAEKIRELKYGVQLKIGSKVRISTFSPEASSLLLEMRQMAGFQQVKGGTWEWKLDERMRRQTFSELREELVQKIEDAGLVPCMTPNDHHAFLKREKWLARQLCPIERMVPVVRTGTTDELSSEETAWEMAYSDTGMQSTFPEVYEQWVQRAKKLRLDEGHDKFNLWYDGYVKDHGHPPSAEEIKRNRPTYTFPYQFEDIIYLCMKAGELQGNVMGLGKTRTGLFASILLGVKRVLIVCPRRLIDVWQDEIRQTLVPFMKRNKRNWNGDIFDSTVNVIEFAKDCREENMRFFNIISYDKLKAVPRDVEFYRCPKCGVVACKKSRNGGTQVCPGNAAQPEAERCSHAVKTWRESCTEGETSLRKHYIEIDAKGNPVINPETGKPRVIPWSQVDPTATQLARGVVKFPRERMKAVDPRPAKPQVQAMDKLDNICKKVTLHPVGTEIDPVTRQEKVVYKGYERTPHVAWTFADMLRWGFPLVVADEALAFMNADSQRAQALFHVCARTRWSMTGTPIKGYPQKILPITNWTIPRACWPDYRDYDPQGTKRFLDKFRTDVTIVREGKGIITEDGDLIGGQKKQIPKINNPELFQAELAPFMRRRVRTEPQVVRSVPRKNIVTQNIVVEMDYEHRDYYRKWQQKFADWWQKMKQEEEGKNVPKGALLTKLTYLINASTIPHKMLDNILEGKDDVAKEWASIIGAYKGPMTAKMKKSWEIILKAKQQGDKSLSFSWRTANQDIGMLWAKKAKVQATWVDGRVSLNIKKGQTRSERHEKIEAFRQQPYDVMFAGLESISEGFNIPEANHGIIMDCGWDPTQPRQALGRMIRPDQLKTVHQYYLMHKGTIDDYMIALCYLKGRSSDEGIDYMEFDDFSTSIIPDIHQYAESIVDGTEEVLKAQMWLAIEHNRRQADEEGDDE